MKPTIGRWYTEVDKGVPLYCTALTDQHACMSYRPGDPIAVSPKLEDFFLFFEDRDTTPVYALSGYLHDHRTHMRLRGLTRREETFLVNNGSPTHLTDGPGKGLTVRVSDIGSLNDFNETQ